MATWCKQTAIHALGATLGLLFFLLVGSLVGWVQPIWVIGKGTIALIYGAVYLLLGAWPLLWIQKSILLRLMPDKIISVKTSIVAAAGEGVLFLPMFIACAALWYAVANSREFEPVLVLVLASGPLSSALSALVVGSIARWIRTR